MLSIATGAHHTVALVQKLPHSGQYPIPQEAPPLHSQQSITSNISSKSRPYDSISDQSDYASHCPLGLEFAPSSLKSSSSISSLNTIGSQSKMGFTKGVRLSRAPSTESFDQGASVFHTADNSPIIEENSIVQSNGNKVPPVKNEDVSQTEKVQPIENDDKLNSENVVSESNDLASDSNANNDLSDKSNGAKEEQSFQNGAEKEITIDKDDSERKTIEDSLQSEKIEKCDENREENSTILAHDTAENVTNSIDALPNDPESNVQNSNISHESINLSVSNTGSANESNELSSQENASASLTNTLNSTQNQSQPKTSTEHETQAEMAQTQNENGLQSSSQVSESESTLTQISSESLPKSRSTFLDENEAKEFLDRQLSGDDPMMKEDGIQDGDQPPPSPLAKQVGNILQVG